MPRYLHLIATLFLALAAFSPLTARARAQEGPEAPDSSVTDALVSLATRAGDVFAGQVVRIARKGGVVEVTFAVEQAVAGNVASIYVLREWAGLWPPGQFRYIVGQRALVFVRPANAAGLSSPVDGAEGVVPLAVTSAAAPASLDVHRLAARVQRHIGDPLPVEGDGLLPLSQALSTVQAARSTLTAGKQRRCSSTPLAVTMSCVLPILSKPPQIQNQVQQAPTGQESALALR